MSKVSKPLKSKILFRISELIWDKKSWLLSQFVLHFKTTFLNYSNWNCPKLYVFQCTWNTKLIPTKKFFWKWSFLNFNTYSTVIIKSLFLRFITKVYIFWLLQGACLVSNKPESFRRFMSDFYYHYCTWLSSATVSRWKTETLPRRRKSPAAHAQARLWRSTKNPPFSAGCPIISRKTRIGIEELFRQLLKSLLQTNRIFSTV